MENCYVFLGRYAVNVGQPFAHVPSSPGGLDAKYKLLPQSLEKVGYRNHIVGKWHLGASKRSFHPLRRGFHSFYGCLGGGINFYSKQVCNVLYLVLCIIFLVITLLLFLWVYYLKYL